MNQKFTCPNCQLTVISTTGQEQYCPCGDIGEPVKMVVVKQEKVRIKGRKHSFGIDK